MPDIPNADSCDKQCRDHGKNTLLLKQHGDRLDNAESTIDIMSSDNSNTEGRLNMFIWAIGIVFMLIASMSFYGVLQLNNFKDVYSNDNRASQTMISDLATSIMVSTNNVKHIKEDVEALKKEQRTFIINSEKQIRTMISLRNNDHAISNPIFDDGVE